MRRYTVDLVLAVLSGANAAAYTSHGHSLNLGLAVACGVAALVPRPSKP